jgi:LysM repeat protein
MEKRSSILARLSAALALAVAVVVVVVIVSSATSDDSHPGQPHHRSGEGKQESSKQRTKAASYTVQSGDTLIAIAHRTGVPVPELLALNPEVDPQILIAGQTLKLR